ncbi:MAG: hypothetical protein ACXVIP_05135, partial [Halobacteriota archaeon]
GLLSEAYHVGIELIVHTAEPLPTNRGTASDTINLMRSTRFIRAKLVAPYLAFLLWIQGTITLIKTIRLPLSQTHVSPVAHMHVLHVLPERMSIIAPCNSSHPVCWNVITIGFIPSHEIAMLLRELTKI